MKLALSCKNAWERLPRPVKAVLGLGLGSLPPEYLLGGGFRHALRFAEEAQWWSAEQSRAYQLAELRRICTIAYERTAFYRRTFSEAGFEPRDLETLEDFTRLPILDREILREHLEEMCTVAPWSPRMDYTSTGGTSGKPLRFYIGSDRSHAEFAYLVASWRRAGFRLGMPLAVFRGRVVAENRSGLRHEYDPVLRQHFYGNFHMSDENMARYLEHVRGIGACFLHVYPSSATALARFLRRSGLVPPPGVKGIVAESEIVYPEQRRLIEDAFRCRVFSCYGLTEKVVAAAECERSTNYHVWPTYGFFELLDDRGLPVTRHGERGEIVGTGFINTVVPFIRYRTGDYATYEGKQCPECSRAHTIITDIRGHRVQEVLVTRDGTLITWTALNVHDDTFDHVLQFQFYQVAPGRAVLRVVPASGFSGKDRRRIQRNLGLKFDHRLDFTIEVVDSVPLSGRGKAIYVDQRIPGLDAGDEASLQGHSRRP